MIPIKYLKIVLTLLVFVILYLQALVGLHEPIAAKQCFEAVLQIEPNNRAAVVKINECDDKLKSQNKLEKSVYSNMFEKFAKRDSKLFLCF